MKRHNDIPTAHNIPPKIARHEPIPNIIEPTENEQFLSDIQQQELTDMFSGQFGYELTQMTPADENVAQELRDFFRDERPWGTDRNLRQVYIRNFHRIRDSETNHRRCVWKIRKRCQGSGSHAKYVAAKRVYDDRLETGRAGKGFSANTEIQRFEPEW